jgi:hypothetical protein
MSSVASLLLFKKFEVGQSDEVHMSSLRMLNTSQRPTRVVGLLDMKTRRRNNYTSRDAHAKADQVATT